MVAQLWRAYGRFDGRSSFSTWMYRIAMNVAISFARTQTRAQRRLVPVEGSLLEEIADQREADTDDRLSQALEFIEQLDPLSRALDDPLSRRLPVLRDRLDPRHIGNERRHQDRPDQAAAETQRRRPEPALGTENAMEIEEIKELWSQSNRRLEASVRLNTALLAQWNFRKANTSLERLSRGITFELISNVLAIVLLGSFAAAHVHEPRFLIPALVLDAYIIALAAGSGQQLAQIKAVDYDAPVVKIQNDLADLRLWRIRTTLWALLFAPLMWVPLLIVALRAIFGVDVYVAGATWLVANVLFGLAVIPLAIFIAKRYGSRIASHTPLRWLADEIAGRSLAEALDRLDAIRRFKKDGSPIAPSSNA